MRRRDFIAALTMGGATLSSSAATTSRAPAEQGVVSSQGLSDHRYFTDLLTKMAEPVLALLAHDRLQREFPVELSPNADKRDKRVIYLECFGRLIAGAAPWLALETPGAEGNTRRKLREYALQAYEHSVNPKSADYLHWDIGEGQLLVDSAYYTQGLLRAPTLWQQQSAKTQARIVKEIKRLRSVRPPYTNWLLFAAMNEAFLLSVEQDYDPMRLDLSVRKLLEWYVGDGWFADGEHFAFDYYNSYVIHPMLLDILQVMAEHRLGFWQGKVDNLYQTQLKRSQRMAEHLERLISPSGTYPPIGRSLTYRTAAFQPLAQLALTGQLPKSLSPGRVRSALRAVHEAIFRHPSNFTEAGFLTIGFAGANPALGDWYSNNGSMYITSNSFLALGLPASDDFWRAPAEAWTQKRAFSGEAFRKDYAVKY